MLTVEEIKKKLSDRKIRKVAQATGISYQTLYDILSGRNDNPTAKTIQALTDYLRG